jgi:hypothetical protein
MEEYFLQQNGRRLEKVEEFVKQISEIEKWNLPPIQIWELDEKIFNFVYFDHRGKRPPEGIKAFPDFFHNRIYIKKGYVNRTTIFHEVWHFIQSIRNEISRIKINLKIEKVEDLLMISEIQAEGFAQRLARKYKKEWENKLCQCN